MKTKAQWRWRNRLSGIYPHQLIKHHISLHITAFEKLESKQCLWGQATAKKLLAELQSKLKRSNLMLKTRSAAWDPLERWGPLVLYFSFRLHSLPDSQKLTHHSANLRCMYQVLIMRRVTYSWDPRTLLTFMLVVSDNPPHEHEHLYGASGLVKYSKVVSTDTC